MSEISPPFRQLGNPRNISEDGENALARLGGIVCVADHASNHVPDGIDLQIPPDLLNNHIAVDIGTERIAELLARDHQIPAHIARVSRLVIDLHRTEESAGLVPAESDGHPIPGNAGADADVMIAERLARFHRPYHRAMEEWLKAAEPALIIALHSFTPTLASREEDRPWQAGLLYNQDDRGARIAIDYLRGEGLRVGDNQPYSGKLLNATMDRHAEAMERDYITLEIRQDLIADIAGQRQWAARIAKMAEHVVKSLPMR